LVRVSPVTKVVPVQSLPVTKVVPLQSSDSSQSSDSLPPSSPIIATETEQKSYHPEYAIINNPGSPTYHLLDGIHRKKHVDTWAVDFRTSNSIVMTLGFGLLAESVKIRMTSVRIGLHIYLMGWPISDCCNNDSIIWGPLRTPLFIVGQSEIDDTPDIQYIGQRLTCNEILDRFPPGLRDIILDYLSRVWFYKLVC
jgi:hypothetical protein